VEYLGNAVGNQPFACVEDVDELWVTQVFSLEYAGEKRFRLCIKVFSNISIVEIFQRLFSNHKSIFTVNLQLRS
jgi:hypothetical protein